MTEHLKITVVTAGLSEDASTTRLARAIARVGDEAATVEIVSVLPRSPTTYQVQWRETVYDHGAALPAQRWTGLFTVAHTPPRNEAQLRANPLGVFITAFQWSRDL